MLSSETLDLTSNNTSTTHNTIDTNTKTPPPPTQPTNTPKSLSFTTVTLKRLPHLHPTTTAATTNNTMNVISYKECLKNHAASIGGHALDGCGEFMASSSTDPLSLKCAACGCHRNFHRRDPPEPSTTTPTKNNPNFPNCFYSPPPPPPPPPSSATTTTTTAPPPLPPQPLPHRTKRQSTSPSLSSSPSHSPSPISSPSSPPPLSHVPPSYHHHHHHHHRHSSAPHHRLFSLGNAYSVVASLPSSDHHHELNKNNNFNNNNNNNNSKKRHRTKFSQEQKEKMYRFSEKLGWRMQKGDDDGSVQEFCNEIGVPRGVFKIWMHNNKNTFNKIKRSDGIIDGGNNPQNNNNIDDHHHKINDNNEDGGGIDHHDDNNSDEIHRRSTAAAEDGCVNVHVPIINGLPSS